MNKHSISLLSILLVVVIALPALPTTAIGQSKAQKRTSPPERAPETPHWKVSVSTGGPVRVTLVAKEAPVEKIMSALASKLGAPVRLSPLVKAQRVTAEFTDAPLEDALRALAPQAYVDYSLDGGAASQPKCLGIYLHALNESPPPITASVKARSEAILIEGDTEDPESLPSVKPRKEDEPVLQVSFEQRLLSVRAHRQPFTAVLYEVASKLGVPFEMGYESTEVVDLDWAGQDVADLWRLLPSHARLYLRADLLNHEKKALRIVLLKPAKD